MIPEQYEIPALVGMLIIMVVGIYGFLLEFFDDYLYTTIAWVIVTSITFGGLWYFFPDVMTQTFAEAKGWV